MPLRHGAVRLLITLGIRLGPLALEGISRSRAGGDPGRALVGRRTARVIALEHAAHLVDGSVLPVYDGDLRVWVVFSGERPLATHPAVATPFEVLLRDYDLDTRLQPLPHPPWRRVTGVRRLPPRKALPSVVVDRRPPPDAAGPAPAGS